MTCKPEYILKDCMCLADPLDYYSTICAYISKQDGYLYPCDPGCCKNNCSNNSPDIKRIEGHPSSGVSLPTGFGVNIPQSDKPSAIPGAAPFGDATGTNADYAGSYLDVNYNIANEPQKSDTPGLKVWQIVLIAVLPVIVAIIMSFFLT